MPLFPFRQDDRLGLYLLFFVPSDLGPAFALVHLPGDLCSVLLMNLAAEACPGLMHALVNSINVLALPLDLSFKQRKSVSIESYTSINRSVDKNDKRHEIYILQITFMR
jgi:hypothetical protein